MASTGLLVGAREDPRTSSCETFALEVSLILICSTCGYPAVMLGPRFTGAICLTLLSVSPPLSLALGEPPPPACFCLLRSQPCFFISPTTSERTPHVSGPFSGFFPPFPHFCDIPLFMTPVALVLTRLVLRALCFEGSFFGRAVSTSRISRRSSVSASPVPRERGETHASHGALSSIPLVPHLGGRDRPSVTSSLKTEY